VSTAGEPGGTALERSLRAELAELERAATLKRFAPLASPQGPLVEIEGRGEVLVLSSNDYLGLANDPEVVRAGIEGLRRYGAGTASVRFICGYFEAHRELESDLARLSGTEAALTFTSCWSANEAVIGALSAGAATAVLSDELNHASIVDAIRLARPAHKAVYRHADPASLRDALDAVPEGIERTLIVTDGVFSMEGDLAPLPEIVRLARAHGAAVIVDDSHGTGVMGATGRGTVEHFGLDGQIDAITGTLGKALGGAAGGYVAASAALCDALAQRARPQLFSNALAPTVACSARAAVRALRERPELVERLRANTRAFRERCAAAGLRPLEGEGAIVPIVVGATADAMALSERLLERGVFVTGFGYPVVPEGTARIRVQISAALSDEQVARGADAIAQVAREAGLAGAARA